MSDAASPQLSIRELDTVAEVFEASAVLSEVWGGDRTGMPPNLLRALAHSGNYAVGLFEGERMVGASVAFFAEPAARSMHSHITGILPSAQDQGLGRMLKQHQREWGLRRGIGHVTWTFDPLVSRNAHFNLAVLGARVTEYLVDHYGAMDDGVNRGDESDRLMVSWALAAPPVPTPADAEVRASVSIPRDIESLRRREPDAAAVERRRVRDALMTHLAAGRRIGGFDERRGYLIVSGEGPPPPPPPPLPPRRRRAAAPPRRLGRALLRVADRGARTTARLSVMP